MGELQVMDDDMAYRNDLRARGVTPLHIDRIVAYAEAYGGRACAQPCEVFLLPSCNNLSCTEPECQVAFDKCE